MIGGAAWIGLVIGLILAVIVRKRHKDISIRSIYEWFKSQIVTTFKKDNLKTS